MGIKHSRPVPPFMRYCSAIIPTMFDDSLSYYEALCALNRFIQKNLVEVINNNASVTQEYIDLTNELKEYMEDYFENLDVQEEINNKLDQMAEDGTLGHIIGEYISNTCEYIFPKFWNNASSGDSTILKTPTKNILFDCNGTPRWSFVKDMLDDNEVEHVDVLVISHYDGDHSGNVSNLIGYGYIDANTTAYLSCIPEDFDQQYIDDGEAVAQALESAGATVVYPTEGQTVTIDETSDLDITFANCDADVISAMTPRYNNNASMVCFIRQKDSYSFIGGDAIKAVYKHLFEDLGYPKQPVDLYKISHHGLEYETYVNFVKAISPKYAVISYQDLNSQVQGGYDYTPEFGIIQACGGKILACFDQTDYIKFVSDGSAMECTSGKVRTFDNSAVAYDIYVDKTASTSAPQDGTQSRPFSEIGQALASIPNAKYQEVTIHVADGTYHTMTSGNHYLERLRVNGNKSTTVRIVGNSSDISAVKINNIQANNAHLILSYVTVYTDRFDAIRAINSNIIVQNVDIKSSDGSAHATDGVYASNQSEVSLNNVTIDNTRHAFFISNDSKVVCAASVTVKDHADTIAYITNGGRLITNSNLSFTNASDVYNFSQYAIQLSSPVQLMESHEAYANVTLKKNVNTLKWIEVQYKDNDNYVGSTGRIYNPSGKSTSVTSVIKTGAGKYDLKTARFQFTGTNVNIMGGVKTTVNGTSISAADTSNLFDITAVIGWYEDGFIDVSA